MKIRILCLSIVLAIAPVSAAAEASEVLRTAKGWIQYNLNSNWKVVQMQRRPPQATAQFTKLNPASADSAFAATLTISTFQTQWPEVSAKYNRFVNSISGVKSTSGPWSICRSGLHYLDRKYFNRTAYRDISDVHLLVTLGWFHLPKNDAQYDNQMEATFRPLLASISGGMGKQQ